MFIIEKQKAGEVVPKLRITCDYRGCTEHARFHFVPREAVHIAAEYKGWKVLKRGKKTAYACPMKEECLRRARESVAVILTVMPECGDVWEGVDEC